MKTIKETLKYLSEKYNKASANYHEELEKYQNETSEWKANDYYENAMYYRDTMSTLWDVMQFIMEEDNQRTE